MKTNHKGTWTWAYEVGCNEKIGNSVVFSPLKKNGKLIGWFDSYEEAKLAAQIGENYYIKRRRKNLD